MKENKELSKEAKVLLLKILKQGYITAEQWGELAKELHQQSILVEIIDKTSDVDK